MIGVYIANETVGIDLVINYSLEINQVCPIQIYKNKIKSCFNFLKRHFKFKTKEKKKNACSGMDSTQLQSLNLKIEKKTYFEWRIQPNWSQPWHVEHLSSWYYSLLQH